LQVFLETGCQLTQCLANNCFFVGLFDVMDFFQVLQDPIFHLLSMKLSIDFLLSQFVKLFEFIMQVNFLPFHKKVLLSVFFKVFPLLEEFLLLFFEFSNSFLVIGNFAQEFTINLLFVKKLEDELLCV
jgi:hypothetical protein